MKKFFTFTLLLGSLLLANVQGQVGFIYENNTYTNGASFTVPLPPDAHNCDKIMIKNTSYAALLDIVVTVIPVEVHGIEAWGICAGGVCIPNLTSNSFNLTPGATDSLIIDLFVEETDGTPYSIYNIEVSNGTITNTVTVRFESQGNHEGIDEALKTAGIAAYPNPAQGAFAIRYEVEQPATLTIVDMQGRTVRSIPVMGNGSINVSDLPAGLYAYGIAGGKMQKLIVK